MQNNTDAKYSPHQGPNGLFISCVPAVASVTLRDAERWYRINSAPWGTRRLGKEEKRGKSCKFERNIIYLQPNCDKD